MIRMCFVLGFILSLLVLSSCTKETKSKSGTLVVCYSQTETTKQLAQIIAGTVGADIDSIVPVNPYVGTKEQIMNRNMQEIESKTLPEIVYSRDPSIYDTIFIGTPMWDYSFARPLATWFDKNSLRGKVVIPFFTYEKGGKWTCSDNIKQALSKRAVFKDGFGIMEKRISKAKREFDLFLRVNGFYGLKKEKIKHTHYDKITPEVRAVYDSAMASYPHIKWQIFEYGVGDIPNGKEYVFSLTPYDENNDHIEPRIYVIDYDDEIPEVSEIGIAAWDRSYRLMPPIKTSEQFLKKHNIVL